MLSRRVFCSAETLGSTTTLCFAAGFTGNSACLQESSRALRFRDRWSLEGWKPTRTPTSREVSFRCGKSTLWLESNAQPSRGVCSCTEPPSPPPTKGLVMLPEKMKSIHQNAKSQSGTFPSLSRGKKSLLLLVAQSRAWECPDEKGRFG